MALNIGGNTVKDKSDGGKVIYNGKECTEVWYKESPNAEAFQVWPDILTKQLTLCVARNKSASLDPGQTYAEICWDKAGSSSYDSYSSKDSGGYTYGNIYELKRTLNNNSILKSTGGSAIGRVQFVIESSWTAQVTVDSNDIVYFYCDSGKLYLKNNSGNTFDVTSMFTERGWKGNLSQYKWIRFYRQQNNITGGDFIIYFDSVKAPPWIHN